MRYFPIFLDLDAATVVIVGDGEKIAQKVRLLSKSNADITVICRTLAVDGLTVSRAQGATVLEKAFEPGDIDGARLVIAATDDVVLQRSVFDAARARGIPVNVVDRPDLSTFLVPALVDRDPIVVAIGSEGTAPVLARDIRARIEAMLPSRLGTVARRAAGLRESVKDAVRHPTARKRLWERLLSGPWRDRILAADDSGASRQFDKELADVARKTSAGGRVSLVGAGPGDPDLLTLRAQQRLQEADVIVVDGLVPDEVLDHARRDARRIWAGKEGYGVSTDQGQINAILVREAAKGHKVVRLKGGDPFVFGRAAEEIAAVRAAGIAVDVVPGITAAHACAASIGLPLTLRHKVRQFSVVTGATATGVPDLDWRSLAKPGHAFAIYMGVRTTPAIVERLLAAGAERSLPVVVVENGTRPDERVVQTTLAHLPQVLIAHDIKGPSVIFVGLDGDEAHLTRPAKAKKAGLPPAIAALQLDRTIRARPRLPTPQFIA